MAEFNRSTQNWCVGCMGAKEKTGFIQSLNPYHNTYLPLCRGCLNNRFKQYQKALNSEGAALWCLCAEMGYPVIKEYYDIAISRKTNMPNSSNLFMLYHNTLKELDFKIEGFWQSDLDLSDFAKTGQKIQKAEEKPLDTTEMEKIWGKFTADEYMLLNEFYGAYTEDLPVIDMALSMRYRDLCKAELGKRKADENGDVNEIQKAQKNLNDILRLLKLDNFGQVQKTDEQKAFEKRVAWIEYSKPAECEDLTKFLDMVGYEKEKGEKMRSLRNAIVGTRDYPAIPKEEE